MSTSTYVAGSQSDRALLVTQQFLEDALAAATANRTLPTERELIECFYRFGDYKSACGKRYFTVWSMVEAWRKSRQHSIGKPFDLTRDMRLRLIKAWECRAIRVTH